MSVVIGVLIIASTVLLFTVAVLTARRPNPPIWILNDLSMDLIAIAFTGGLALGTAVVFSYLSEFDSGILGAAEGGMILVILAGVVVIWRVLGVRKTLAKYDAMTPAAARVGQPPSPAGKKGKDPDGPTRPGATPRAGGKKRAA